MREEACGRLAFKEYNGYCTLHYKECLVELINQNGLDPVVLFEESELRAELDRWKVPTRTNILTNQKGSTMSAYGRS
ncbi:hypothetical protein SRHO_G00245350 [Serrasalmus rhombeus]